ncbi:ammonia-forming cytochrome c nitrite reductase subunit c552 [Lacipirellula parvula]|uniref:nitrite reductase (cytochrome; ammonia-forming) n=1 Tax=Lacipirellula parvula TaxID=2650471 RepID=A0A5K7X6N8_9BACT|nr:ammonia-forming cytochrome c nitrite reductase subunit c552 [Lacipirellula parvula]BBO31492.1 cytochrome c nitrite reductase [Lacipirellula parvula]
MSSAAAKTPATKPKRSRGPLLLALLAAVVALATVGVAALLISIFEHKQEGRTPFVRLVDVKETSTDPVPWGINWPSQFDSYRRTVDDEETERGGSSAMPASKLDEHPWLKRLYAGYAFSIDYREARGHAYMLYDQEVTDRVTQRPQSGACLHCHASIIPTYRRLGLEAEGKEADAETLANDFNWPAVMEGFKLASAMEYSAAHNELLKTPDGTPGEKNPLFPGGNTPNTPANPPASEGKPSDGEDDVGTGEEAAGKVDEHHLGDAHPVACIDCHDPKTMELRITRPGFINGIAALAESDDPVPHMPSVERWRKGNRQRPYDPNVDASRQEKRSFVCGQCHVEYYCGPKETLFFPWQNGLKIEQIEKTYDGHKFPDGEPFYDFVHGETGAHVYKAQHPEFEMWSQGIHARSGVSCADCHMPYQREGAMKVSSHWVRSPLLNTNNACQTCHNVPEEELRDKVATIQGRTTAQIERAAVALTDMLDAIRDAEAAGATEEELGLIFELQKKAAWRLDFVSSENSKGFHADQEAMRILGESIDYSRQAEAAALRLRAPKAPESTREVVPVEGVTPARKN